MLTRPSSILSALGGEKGKEIAWTAQGSIRVPASRRNGLGLQGPDVDPRSSPQGWEPTHSLVPEAREPVCPRRGGQEQDPACQLHISKASWALWGLGCGAAQAQVGWPLHLLRSAWTLTTRTHVAASTHHPCAHVAASTHRPRARAPTPHTRQCPQPDLGWGFWGMCVCVCVFVSPTRM